MKTYTCCVCNKQFEARRTAACCSTLCRNKRYVSNNLEKDRAWKRKHYRKAKDNPENTVKYLLKYAKSRSVKKGLEFSLTEKDIVIPKVCPVFRTNFTTTGRKYTPSIDRIDPSKGYIPGNIQIISQLANAIKWDSTREERITFANWILSSEGGYCAYDR